MGWRGKYRDSSESAGDSRKKETPKVSRNGPCSLNIRSNPPAQPPAICVGFGRFAGLMKTVLFGVRWEGYLSPRGNRRVIFWPFLMPRCYTCILIYMYSIIMLLLLFGDFSFSSNLFCVFCAY